MGFGLPGFIINAVRIFFVAVPLAYIFVFILGYGFLSIDLIAAQTVSTDEVWPGGSGGYSLT
jgi:Na+-driven multidrug efflux pump